MNMHSKNSLGILKFETIWKSKNITHFGAGGGSGVHHLGLEELTNVGTDRKSITQEGLG